MNDSGFPSMDELFKGFDTENFGNSDDFFGSWFNQAGTHHMDASSGKNAAIFNPEDLKKAMFTEMQNLQGAGDRQFQKMEGFEDKMSDFIGGMQDRAKEQMIDIKPVNQHDAVQRAETALSQFNDMTGQNLAAAASGVDGQFQAAANAIRNGRRSDGTLMTSAEQAQARYQLEGQKSVARAQALTPIVNQHNAQKAAMGFQVAGIMADANKINMQASQINAGLQMQVDDLMLRGQMALGQFMANNKESVVSVFSGMMQLIQAGMDLSQWRDSNTNEEHMLWYQTDQGGGSQMLQDWQEQYS